MKKSLVVVTAAYPYDTGEEFMDKEIAEATKYFDKILIYPLENSNNLARKIPAGVEVRNCLCNKKFPTIRKKWTEMVSILLLELIKSGRFSFVLKNTKSLLRALYQCSQMAHLLSTDLKKSELGQIHFYSVWMNLGATTLAILKKRNQISNLVFRLHGYDLFDERREGNYMPFRVFNFKWANRVFVLSKAGATYIKAKKLYEYKIETNYSGLYNQGLGPFDPNAEFTVISCSNLHKFKRVHLILEALQRIDFNCTWYHVGDGEQLSALKTQMNGLPKNVKVKFLGRIPNQELLTIYQQKQFNLFVHLSQTEGLGMAAVEAQSFGIPALSVDVGGVSEVVNDQTGILLNADANADDVAKEIKKFRVSDKNTSDFRSKVRECFLKKFEAEENYKNFFDRIITINQG
ncbi:MAG: glycosyltransferase [Crocinitomicaceae bacterium]